MAREGGWRDPEHEEIADLLRRVCPPRVENVDVSEESFQDLLLVGDLRRAREAYQTAATALLKVAARVAATIEACDANPDTQPRVGVRMLQKDLAAAYTVVHATAENFGDPEYEGAEKPNPDSPTPREKA